jgi:hypothetical protein
MLAAGVLALCAAHASRRPAQVFTVVKAMQQTSVSADSPVMTVKGSTTPVQVANSEFYVDPATGHFRTRTPSGSTSGGSARHLLQDADPTARIASADFNLHSSGLMKSNILSQPSLFASFAVDEFSDVNGSSSGRHLLQTTTTTTAPLTVLPPVCDWAADDLFDFSSCAQVTASGTVTTTSTTRITKPYYNDCLNMHGACQNFVYATKVSVPMWVEGYGTGLFQLAGRMCVCGVRFVTLMF